MSGSVQTSGCLPDGSVMRKGGEPRIKLCKCHNYPMRWSRDSRCKAGGYWRCVPRRRQSWLDYYNRRRTDPTVIRELTHANGEKSFLTKGSVFRIRESHRKYMHHLRLAMHRDAVRLEELKRR